VIRVSERASRRGFDLPGCALDCPIGIDGHGGSDWFLAQAGAQIPGLGPWADFRTRPRREREQ
jgi:hypothetical protein